MSGKHVKIRALRSGVGTPVLSVGIGLVAWVVIGLALVLLPHPRDADLGGSAQAGSTRPGSGDASARAPSPEDESFGEAGSPTAVEASPSARPRPGTAGSAESGTIGDAVEEIGSAAPSTEPEAGTETEVGSGAAASTEPEEMTESPWTDAPGKAKGHHKRPPRDRDEP